MKREPPKYLTVSPDLRIPVAISAHLDAGIIDDGDGPYHVNLLCSYRPESARYEVDRLELLRRGPHGEPVTSAGIRRVRVQDVLRSFAEVNIQGTDDGWRPAAAPRPRPQTDREYRDAAREYVAARILGDPPLERVASAYSVSRPTATRIVAEARRRGFSTDG